MSSFNTGYFSDASGSDANTPYRHRGRTQMTKTLSSNTNSGVNSPTMTTSVSYSSVGHNAKRNSVSSNHSYRSLTSLHGGMPFAIEDEIREPATERLRRRLTRMARKMKRKMNAAGRKLRRNSSSSSSSSTESATGNRAGSSWDAVRSPSGSQRCPVSYSQYGTDTDVMQCIATVDCRTQVKDISDPWMDLEWQF
jgi:Mg-chelatase subunit ChlI